MLEIFCACLRACNTPGVGSALRSGIVKRTIQVTTVFLFEAAVLFLATGRLDWSRAWTWVLVGLNLAGIAVNALT